MIAWYWQAKESVADLNANSDQDEYRRVQRTRARKVSAMLERKNSLPKLMIASVLLSPVEKVMLLGWQEGESGPD